MLSVCHLLVLFAVSTSGLPTSEVELGMVRGHLDHLVDPPSLKGIRVPPEIIEQYRNLTGEEPTLDKFHRPGSFVVNLGKAVRSVKAKIRPRGRINILTFDFEDVELFDEISEVQLQVRWIPSSGTSRQCQKPKTYREELMCTPDLSELPVYFSMKLFSLAKERESTVQIDTKQLLRTTPPSWHTFDVKPAFARWRRDRPAFANIPASTFLLMIKNGQLRNNIGERFGLPQGEIAEAFLLVYGSDSKETRERRKRERGERRRKKGRKTKGQQFETGACRLQKYEVNFEDIGWDNWIMSPTGFPMNFCSGTCDLTTIPGHLNPTNHAVVQHLYNSVFPHMVPDPSCVPTAHQAVNILYIVDSDNDERVVLKTYRQMTVTQCGCR